MSEHPRFIPCAHCGSDDIDPEYLAIEIDGADAWAVGCNGCGATAVSPAAWNMRAFVPPAMPESEAVRALQTELQTHRLALAAAVLELGNAISQELPADWREWLTTALRALPEGMTTAEAIDAVAGAREDGDSEG